MNKPCFSIQFFTIKRISIVRQTPWVHSYFAKLLKASALQALSLVAVLLLMGGCKKEGARMTAVYGKVTDQTGQPVDSVTILFAGTLKFSAGFPIKETLTDSSGSYELVVDVPKEYNSAGITASLRSESLRGKYSAENRLIYKNSVQTNNCCNSTIGKKTKYDFVLLPK
jgi:hypothetical protein